MSIARFSAVVTLMGLVILVSISIWALRRLPDGVRIPMQWGLSGDPTWTAPKMVGVWLTPLVALGVMAFMHFNAAGAPSSGETQGAVIRIVTVLIFVGVHFAHMYFAGRAT